MESNPYQTLSEQYGIPGHVTFQAGPGGLAAAVIDNPHASAVITLAGGHLVAYQPKGQEPVLWVSPNAVFETGKAIRGGIPICWPWFGQHPSDSSKPMHGFVRTMVWSVAGTRVLEDGATEVRLLATDTPETLALWPHAFRLEAIFTVGAALRVELSARNTGSEPFTYTAGLHPYFHVSGVHRIRITGLEGVSYLDKEENFRRKPGEDTLRIAGPIDRIYTGTERDMVIHDEGYGRAIRIRKIGSRTSVVWNPGENAARMPDLGAGNARAFVCAETVNAVEDTVTVAPGEEARLGMEVTVERQGGL